MQAFRNSRGPRYTAPSGFTGGLTGAQQPVGTSSEHMYNSYGNIPHGSNFDTLGLGQEPYQESAGLSNSAAQSGQEVTLNLNQRSAL
jgi:hypothetical protein